LKKQDIPILITVILTFIFLVITILGQAENDIRNMLLITMFFAGVSVLILVVKGAPRPAPRPPQAVAGAAREAADAAREAADAAEAAANAAAAPAAANHSLIKNVVWLFLGSGIALIIAIIITLTYQYIPSNQIPEEFNPQDSPFVATVTRDSTILVPLRNILTPINASIEANIYHKNPNNTIQNVKLFSSDSVLTFKPDFLKVGEYKNGEIWKNNISVRHDLSVSNTSKIYQIRISYLNSTGQLNQLPLQFEWPIKMLDLDLVSYFWIVLIGVITSRALTLFRTQKTAFVQLQIKDYIWIVFSFIIGILIFSSFKNQIDPTSDIIINISLAFGFGFGFEKVLEVGEDFVKPE
jgi:hypothetical protein